MADKILQTRIALKYDLYENWKDSELVLYPGEIGLCEISDPTKLAPEDKAILNVTEPTVIFKVGGATNEDGSLKKFKYLPWASAKAADVSTWAKASEVKCQDKKLIFVGGNADGSDKEISFDYITLTDVKEITDGLNSKITALENITGTNVLNSNASLRTDITELQKLTSNISNSTDLLNTGLSNLEKVINNDTTGLAKVYDIASNTAANVSNLNTRVTDTESSIEALQAIISSGNDSNATLRSDINALQELTSDSKKGNDKLRSDLDVLTGIINHETTGLAAVKVIADNNTTSIDTLNGKVAAIENDYLKAADDYILGCGDAATVLHEMTNN